MELVLDVETTTYTPNHVEGKSLTGGDPRPYRPENKLVMVQYKFVGQDKPILYPKGGIEYLDPEGYIWFNHVDFEGDISWSQAKVQAILNLTTLMVGHNLKFDMSWLYECGFIYEGRVWDTMIFEYLQAKGMKPGLKLSQCAERRGCSFEKTDFLLDNLKAGINTDQMDPLGLADYGMRDIDTTEELYLKQKQLKVEDTDTKTMGAVQVLMNEMLLALTEMERNGCAIDIEALEDLEREYKQEQDNLELKLQEIVQTVMGDKPYNLGSPEQLSQIIYGLKFKDGDAKKRWAQEFDIGTEIRNGVKKKKYPRSLSDSKIDRLIKECMDTVYRTEAHRCPDCDARGYYYKTKKDGSPFKKSTRCSSCDGEGVQYISTGEKGGLRIKHPGSWHVTANGFASGKDTIEELLKRADGKKLTRKGELAKEFLQASNRLSAVNVYINSFIGGIRKGMAGDILHPSFNQCITATGRLSSTSPNAQNFPRGNTFPIKKVFVSRFKGGKLLSCDKSQLEFRAAAYLSQCEAAMKFIEDGTDIHMVSGEFYFPEINKVDAKERKLLRTKAKAHTFAPLFGMLNEYAEHFYETFPGIREWHKRLGEEALETKQVVAPSGRIYAFPFAKRDLDKYGRPIVKPTTQIYNYPVQGFATADIMVAICVKLWYLMKEAEVKSKLILTVHDDITADVHPDEEEIMIKLFDKAFGSVYDECLRRFGVKINVPLDYEMSIGYNWLEQEEINLKEINNG